jgi:hypothetical protein
MTWQAGGVTPGNLRKPGDGKRREGGNHRLDAAAPVRAEKKRPGGRFAV